MALPVPRFSVHMLDRFPDDGNRYELLEGVLIVTPAPDPAHQIVMTRMANVLSNALRQEEQACVVAAGVIQHGRTTRLQPDILVYPAAFSPTAHWRDFHGWWLAVEVMSRASRIYDREVKRGAYLALGVEEYWLLDTDACSAEAWTRAEPAGRSVTHQLVWHPSALRREIAIDLNDIFRDAPMLSGEE